MVYFDPSGVPALPLGLAAEESIHYFGDYFSLFLFSLGHILFPKKGLYYGFEILHRVKSLKK